MIRVGIVGTGYAAKTRVRAFEDDRRSQVLKVAGRSAERADWFAKEYGLKAVGDWQSLVEDDEIDLVVVATVSSLHGDVVQAALEANKDVVVEYPLSLDLAQAERLVAIARARQRLLHIEHIELLGGLHQAMKAYLPRIGTPSYANYRTINVVRPAPLKWTYQLDLFGFPFCGALSRVHRMTQLFGSVSSVDCCTRIVRSEKNSDYFSSALSSARLQFKSGLVAELTYGKGDGFWVGRRTVEIQGRLGALVFDRNEGNLVTAEGTESIAVKPRKGLFAKDTQGVLDYLTEGAPLYVNPGESLYALRVGDALRRASESGETVCVEDTMDVVKLF